MLMTLTAGSAFLVTLLYAMRAGALAPTSSMLSLERLIRGGLGAILVTLTAGLVERARTGAPFEWFHLLIFLACTITAAAFIALLSGQLIALHRLAHRLGRSTCLHPECVHGRGEIQDVTGIATQADQPPRR